MARTNERIEARFYHREGTGYRCDLCPHRCHIEPGQYGRCGTRRADDDMLVAYSYGKVSSLCVDPVEREPLYHFRPGSRCFSVGSIGCNLHCDYCENYAISQLETGKKRTTYLGPQGLVSLCRQERQSAIAFTYNEPMVWFEYIMDVARIDPDLDILLITNGMLEEEPLIELCSVASAVNMDIKSFSDTFYRNICGGRLEDVLHSASIVHERGVHLELTYLVIPDMNDSDEEVGRFCRWVRDSLSPDVPVHFKRFHPDNRMTDAQWTPSESVMRCRDIGLDSGLDYVYVGNTLSDGADDTYCPECGAVLVRRLGYLVDIVSLDGPRCMACRHDTGIVRR
ncbi:MAG: AmmeMemoRadiSam system radical SAM enzyme [Candidatus Methanomethylophilaceae archaeon]|nr:AmmeMemoRadiSam system radical SAM enzyme [Candidatus Methanomethylophilaceae archaeon]